MFLFFEIQKSFTTIIHTQENLVPPSISYGHVSFYRALYKEYR